MKLGNMFKKTNQKNYITLTNRKANVQNSGESSPEVPEGLMRKCNACRAVVLAESIIGNQYICPKCGKKKPDDGYSLCELCRIKHRNRKKEKKNREGQRTLEMALSGETCFFCKSPDVVPGKKLCQACIDKRVAYLHGEKQGERKKKRDQNLPGVQDEIPCDR